MMRLTLTLSQRFLMRRRLRIDELHDVSPIRWTALSPPVVLPLVRTLSRALLARNRRKVRD
jgi:hypothetical protein